MDKSIRKKIGTHYTQLDTPSLVLDIDSFKYNLDIVNFKLNANSRKLMTFVKQIILTP